MNKSTFFRELLGPSYDSILRTLRLEQAPGEMRDNLIELLGETVFDRVIYEILTRLDEENRERCVSLLERGASVEVLALVRTQIPQADILIADWARDELRSTAALARD